MVVVTAVMAVVVVVCKAGGWGVGGGTVSEGGNTWDTATPLAAAEGGAGTKGAAWTARARSLSSLPTEPRRFFCTGALPPSPLPRRPARMNDTSPARIHHWLRTGAVHKTWSWGTRTTRAVRRSLEAPVHQLCALNSGDCALGRTPSNGAGGHSCVKEASRLLRSSTPMHSCSTQQRAATGMRTTVQHVAMGEQSEGGFSGVFALVFFSGIADLPEKNPFRWCRHEFRYLPAEILIVFADTQDDRGSMRI